MNSNIYNIPLLNLLWTFIPISIVILIYIKWTEDKTTLFLALFRMIIQLILIGYVLTYIFESKSSYLIILILSIMLIVASIISLRPLKIKDKALYKKSFISIFTGSSFTLITVIGGVMSFSFFFEPKILIPLSGMIFANSMNAVSIAAERFESETENKLSYKKARSLAYKASLIPTINALFAVGLVSLPGMMSGQILSGVDPLIAVRYQIMVMLMILGSGGISVAVYLKLMQKF